MFIILSFWSNYFFSKDGFSDQRYTISAWEENSNVFPRVYHHPKIFKKLQSLF